MKHIIAGLFDFALFFYLWLGLGIFWILAFVISTGVVWAGWWALEWLSYGFLRKY